MLQEYRKAASAYRQGHKSRKMEQGKNPATSSGVYGRVSKGNLKKGSRRMMGNYQVRFLGYA
jgi:hypothetical protein